MNTKKHGIITALCLLAILSVHAQNGFVKLATLNFEWVEENCWENRIAIKQNGKYGFCDSAGAIKIPAQFSNYNSFSNGYAAVTTDGSNYFYINAKGEPVINKNKEQVTPIGKDGFYRISDGKTTFYDKALNEAVELPVKQLYAGDYSEGLFPVLSNDNLWGYANISPRVVIPCIFKSITPFKDGLAVVSKGETNENKRGVINSKGEEVIPFEYHMIFRMKNYFILEKKEQLAAFDITNMKMVTDQLEMRYYNYMNLFSKNYKIAKNSKGQLALFNSQLKQECVISCDDCRLADDENGLVAVKKNALWGLIDHTGNEITPCEYEDISTLQNGLIKVTKKQISGFLDKTGKLLIPLQLTRSGSFYTKFITVKYKGNTILIRPKSDAEFKQETQLIAQKKLPTAEECFDMALADDGLKERQQTNIAGENNDFEKRNNKQQVLTRQVTDYFKYLAWFNESFDKWVKESTACLKAPVTKTTTSYQQQHAGEVVAALTGILQNLKRIRGEFEALKKINYEYLCSNNNGSIIKKMEENKNDIVAFLDAHELKLNMEVKLLQSYSFEGGDFTRYANQIKGLANYQITKSDPQLLKIADSGAALKKLFEGCK